MSFLLLSLKRRETGGYIHFDRNWNCADAEISGKTLRLSAPDFHSRWEPEDGGRYYRLNGSSDFPFTEKELPNQILDTISSSCKILLGLSYALGRIILAPFWKRVTVTTDAKNDSIIVKTKWLAKCASLKKCQDISEIDIDSHEDA